MNLPARRVSFQRIDSETLTMSEGQLAMGKPRTVKDFFASPGTPRQKETLVVLGADVMCRI